MKKIVTILLCMTLLCPILAYADGTESAYFEAAEYNETISFLSAIGILSREDVSLDTQDWTISRSEFVRLAVRALGQDGVAAALELESPFIDVSSAHPYAKSIFFAAKSNLLGNGLDSFFRPDQPLTTEFAARLGVCMTGRDILVKGNRTYLSLASEAKLFDGVEIYDGDKISRGGALLFLKNVLTADVVAVDSMSGSSMSGVQTAKDKTILSMNLKLEKRRGVVTADGLTTVFGEQPRAGYISVDGVPYLSLYANTIGLAGKMVDYYVKNDDGIEAVQYVEERKNSVLTLDVKSIQSFDPLSISYQAIVEGKTKTLPIDRKAYIAYNFEPDYAPERMKPATGTVTLIDHEDDGTYNAVLIQEFTNTVVDTYSSYSEIIYDIKDNKKDADMSGYDFCTLTDMQNVPVDPTSLEKYSVVSVYKSASGNKVHMIVSTSKKIGTLTGIDLTNGVCTFGNQSYRLSKDVRFDSSTLTPGDPYTYYFDALGEIAFVISDAGTMAYLLQGMKGSGLSSEVTLRVLPEDTQAVTEYKLAPKVRVQTPTGDNTLKREAVYQDVLLDAHGDFQRAMALIRLNNDGEINSITTAMEIDTYAKISTAPEYPLYHLTYLNHEWPAVLGGSSTGSSMDYQYTIGGFGRWLIVGSGAKMFYVPENGSPIGDLDAITVRKVSYSNGDSESRRLQYYAKDLKDVSVRYMVNQTAAASEHNQKNWPFVVTDIVQCYSDKLGSSTYRLTLKGSSEYTLMTADENLVKCENFFTIDGVSVPVRVDKKQLEVGDIISYATDGAGYVNSILLLWDAQANLDKEFNDDGDTAPRFGALGTVAQTSWNQTGWRAVPGNLVRKYDNVIEIVVDKTDTMQTQIERLQRVKWGGDNTTYLVDFSGREVTITRNIAAGELVPGDRIVILSESGRSYTLVAYRR